MSASKRDTTNPHVLIGADKTPCEKHCHAPITRPALCKFSQLESLYHKVVWAIVAQDMVSWQPAIRETVQVGHFGKGRAKLGLNVRRQCYQK